MTMSEIKRALSVEYGFAALLFIFILIAPEVFVYVNMKWEWIKQEIRISYAQSPMPFIVQPKGRK